MDVWVLEIKWNIDSNWMVLGVFSTRSLAEKAYSEHTAEMEEEPEYRSITEYVTDGY